MARPSPGLRCAAACLLAFAGLGGERARAADPPPVPCVPASSTADAGAERPHPLTDRELVQRACSDAAGHDAPTTVPKLYGRQYRGDGGDFAAKVRHAHDGLTRKVHDWEWEPVAKAKEREDAAKKKKKDAAARAKKDSGPATAMDAFANFLGGIISYGLWILVAILILVAIWKHRAWISWIRDLEVPEAGSSIETVAVEPPPPLPDDIPTAVRKLWQRGEQRAALALLYQAAVQRLSDRLGAPMPPGATEGECLSRSRKLADRRYAGLFTRIVACWQAAAYARRMPDTSALETLLDEWNQRPPALPQAGA